MKIFHTFLLFLFASVIVMGPLYALKGVPATAEDIARLKGDLLIGKIQIGKTRLSHIQNEYGEAENITDDNKRLTYDFSELRLTFERERLWRSWEYDSFREPVYTDKVDDLRFDLESKELVGKNITYNMVLRSYGAPTESHETDEDGNTSVYYYGDIKMVFENIISVRSWRGSNLADTKKAETDLNSQPAAKASEAEAKAEVKAEAAVPEAVTASGSLVP